MAVSIALRHSCRTHVHMMVGTVITCMQMALACMQVATTRTSPRYFCTNSDPTTRMNEAVVWCATALASIVLPAHVFAATENPECGKLAAPPPKKILHNNMQHAEACMSRAAGAYQCQAARTAARHVAGQCPVVGTAPDASMAVRLPHESPASGCHTRQYPAQV
eukprot:362824-Chlamydomonas_euryale.AAC.9